MTRENNIPTIHTNGRFIPGHTRLSEPLRGQTKVLPRRCDIAASIAAPTGQREDEMIATLIDTLEFMNEDDPAQVGRIVVNLIATWENGAALADSDFLFASLAMSMAPARDELWRVLTPQRARESLPFWKEVLLRTPPGVRTAALAVTGMVAWVAGEGALMKICLAEAEETDRHYPLVAMLAQISRDRVHPSCWVKISTSAQRSPTR